MRALLLNTVMLVMLCISTYAQQAITKENLVLDISEYANGINANHVNPFDYISKKEFFKEAARLKDSSEHYSADELLVALMQLNAKIQDEHTTIGFQDQNVIPFDAYWFDEGLYTIYTHGDNYAASFSKIVSINNVPLDSVVSRIATIIPGTNTMQVRYRVPWYINSPVILRGLHIIADTGGVALTVKNDSGNITSVLNVVPANQNRAGHRAYQGGLLRFKSNLHYWFQYDSVKNYLYFKYNSCMPDPRQPFPAFLQNLENEIRDKDPERIVVDMRDNGGGKVFMLEPFIEYLKLSKYNKKGKLFVLIGKRTFSAAILNSINLKREAKAILAGEETSGSVNHYGAIEDFTLPNTKLKVVYSTHKVVNNHSYDGPLLPDIKMPEKFADFVTRKDVLLDYVSIVRVL